MALTNLARYVLALVAIISGAGLFITMQQQQEQRGYNQAIASADYAAAASFAGDNGRFAEAYGLQLDGDIKNARIMYGDLGRAEDEALRAAALYNLGNSFMKQVAQMDIEAESDRAFPLIELAKSNYRKSLAINSENWAARRNLQRALLLLPDANPKVPMEVQGRQGAVRTVTSADSRKNYP